MGAMLAGVMRLPFTSILFALELTGNASALPALLIACTTAYGVSVFLMKRSILTEKVARRGFDIFREYTVDRLEHMAVKDVMTTEIMTIPGDIVLREATQKYFGTDQKYRAYPVVDGEGRLLNVINRDELARLWQADPEGTRRLADLLGKDPVVSFPDESCKSVAIRAAVEKLDRMPVVSADRQLLLGMVTRYDLLKPYTHHHEEERIRERFIGNGR
jgi:CBS domain-containing protein